MKKFLFVILLLIGVQPITWAQLSSPLPSQMSIDGTAREGYHIGIMGRVSQVRSLWSQHTQSFGQSKKKEGYLVIENPRINGATYLGMKLYAQFRQTEGYVRLWFGADKLNDNANETLLLQHVLQKTLKDFVAKNEIKTASLARPRGGKGIQVNPRSSKRQKSDASVSEVKTQADDREEPYIRQAPDNGKPWIEGFQEFYKTLGGQ